MEIIAQYTNLLILLQNFENLWNMYSVSEGFLYRRETKRAGRIFLELFDIVADKDPSIRNTKALTMNNRDSTDYIDGLRQGLGEWVESDRLFPFSSKEMGDNENSRFILQRVLVCVSSYLVSKIQLEYRPILCKSSGEGAFHKNNVKWGGHFPWEISDTVDEQMLDSLSNSETVVVVGDIRKSQDLITYATRPDSFRKNMVSYIEMIRKIVLANKGIYDRFTGDGFICYFNAYLLQKFNMDLYKTVVEVCEQIQCDSKTFFADWQKDLQKIPEETIGLSVGVDSGTMNFYDDRMMFAIGTPAVWATRMCSLGKAGDIIMNNQPHVELCHRDLKYVFDEVTGATKSGERVKAFKFRYDEVDNGRIS
jgi:class 3 adenylate cyclase